jgi:hypothetical protein
MITVPPPAPQPRQRQAATQRCQPGVAPGLESLLSRPPAQLVARAHAMLTYRRGKLTTKGANRVLARMLLLTALVEPASLAQGTVAAAHACLHNIYVAESRWDDAAGSALEVLRCSTGEDAQDIALRYGGHVAFALAVLVTCDRDERVTFARKVVPHLEAALRLRTLRDSNDREWKALVRLVADLYAELGRICCASREYERLARLTPLDDIVSTTGMLLTFHIAASRDDKSQPYLRTCAECDARGHDLVGDQVMFLPVVAVRYWGAGLLGNLTGCGGDEREESAIERHARHDIADIKPALETWQRAPFEATEIALIRNCINRLRAETRRE